ncbi:MAG: DoxX family protein [Segetibacter sp.]
MSAFYIAAGINHFRSPGTYNRIMPSYLPYHYTLIYISGIFETGFGILLLFVKTRRFAAWGLIALLLAVFPANIQMLINYLNDNNSQLWVAIVRLPLQIPLILWAYTFTNLNRTRKI